MTALTQIICIGCPKGCHITVEHEVKTILKISGYQCDNGLAYGKSEFTEPKRVFTSTVKISGGALPFLPVKTKTPIPKEKMFECAKAVCALAVQAPVAIGDVICQDLCGTGAALIATRDIPVA